MLSCPQLRLLVNFITVVFTLMITGSYFLKIVRTVPTNGTCLWWSLLVWVTEKQRTLERDFSFFEKAPCHLKVLPLCAGRDGARYQGWVVKKKKGSGLGTRWGWCKFNMGGAGWGEYQSGMRRRGSLPQSASGERLEKGSVSSAAGE